MLEKYYRFTLRLCKLLGIAVIAHGNRWASITPPAVDSRISSYESFTEFRPWPVNRTNISQFSPIFHSQIHISRAPDTKATVFDGGHWLMFIFGRELAINQTPQAQIENWTRERKIIFHRETFGKIYLLVHFSPFAAGVLVCHVLIAKNKMRNRGACADLWFSAFIVFIVGNHFHMHSNNSFIDESCLICTNTLGAGENLATRGEKWFMNSRF